MNIYYTKAQLLKIIVALAKIIQFCHLRLTLIPTSWYMV